MRPPSRILISARILLDRTQREVAAECKLSKKTVYFAEKGDAGIGAVEKLVRHYEGNGIVFLKPEGDEGWGVRTTFLRDDYDRDP